MKISKYENFVVASEDDQFYILEKDYSFYRLNKENIEDIIFDSKPIKQEIIKENFIYAILSISIIVVSLILYFGNASFVMVDKYFWIATILLLINIPIHELGHILSLKFFYPDARFKMGFTFVFIYPAFYVDTSYSYMLPKYKRIAIYLFGNVMNCIFLLIIKIFFPNLIPYCYIIVSNILINFIPIVKSDGYYAFLTLFNKHNKAKSKKEEFVEDFIRGFIMFLLLYVFSYIF